MALSSNEKLGIMNQQLFNKKETIILSRNDTDEIFSDKVDKNVLAGMLANFESLGYEFTKEDILKMADMSEKTLTEQVYTPLLEAMKEAKGANVEHHVLFPDFPDSVRTLDIEILSAYRFMSYFTVIYDEYLFEQNAFEEGSLTSELMEAMKEEYKAQYHGNGQDVLNSIRNNSIHVEENTPEKEAIEKEKLITVHLGTIDDYYQMVNNMLSGKTSLSDYDKDIVRFALENVSRDRYMPETIPFKETWALVAADDFANQRYNQINIKSIPDFERLVAALTPNADVSLSKKQKYRNFTNQERKALYQVFKNALKNNYPIMRESAIPRESKHFMRNILKNRLHFDQMKDGKAYTDFVTHTDSLRSKMSYYEQALQKENYKEAAERLSDISSGVLLDHAKNILAKAERKDIMSVYEILNIIKENCRNAPMDKLLTLNRMVESNISAEDELVKFRFARSKYVTVNPFDNASLKLSEQTQKYLSGILTGIIKEQLSQKEDIGKVYIEPALKNCPIPTVGRTDSGKNRTVATGTKIPYADNGILRAALYKKGPRNGFFDFSSAFLDKNYRMVGQISWNNLKEGDFAYHSGDCSDTKQGVTEIIDVNLDKIKERFPDAKYVVYEGMAWNKFTTVDELSECFLTLSNVNEVGEDIKWEGENPLNPADVKFRVDLTGPAFANIPIIYDLDEHVVTILNMATFKSLSEFGKQDDINRHFNLSDKCEAIENYSGILAQTAYYINERLMQDKPSMYDLAMLNVEARNGELVENKEEADVIFAMDREDVREDQKLVSIYDKDVINTEYIVPKDETKEKENEKTVEITSPKEDKDEPIELNMDLQPEEMDDEEKKKEKNVDFGHEGP